ncbi:MAG: sensor histidine kinase, partial [Sporichthyaceae bacterium]
MPDGAQAPGPARLPASHAWLVSKLAGAGEMGPLLLRHDWSAGPLGPIENWSITLRLAVAHCVVSRHPMLLWWGPDLVTIYNDGYRPLLGGKHPGAVGMTGAQMWPEIWDQLEPMLTAMFAGGEATWYSNQQLFLERHGYSEETYFTYSNSPLFASTGAVAGIISATVETTAAVLSARRMRTIAELIAGLRVAENAGQVLTDAAERLAGNDADLAGVRVWTVGGRQAPAQLAAAGHTTLTLSAEQLASVAAGARGQRLRTAEEGAVYAMPIRVDGDAEAQAVLAAALSPRLPFDAHYRQFLDAVADHVATAVGAAGRAAAERARAATLAEVDAAKTVFFSEISHELRTPLTLIAAPIADLLARRRGPINSGQEEFLQIAARNAGRLTELVRGMLDFARIEAGRLSPDVVAVDLPALTSALAASFSPAIAAAGLSFDIEVNRLPRPVLLDPDMWDRIVLNLLSNALKYTLTGRITLRLRDGGGAVELSVADTGVGIAEQDLPRLFERFYRARTGGRSVEGSGIGLALVWELARLHSGE